MKRILCLGLMTALLGTTANAEPMPADASRIVTLGGTITEIVFALGVGERVVGVDASSSFPEAVNQLPKVAYHRRLSAEGVLSLTPTLIIATTEAGPPAAIQQLKSAGVTVLVLPHEPTVEGAIAQIERIAAALAVQARGAVLIQSLKEDLHQVQASIPQTETQAKILFLYARGQGTLMVAGQDTAADTMIGLAGGTNAIQGYSGYKPLTSEAAVAAAPDVVLLMDSGLESVGGVQKLWQLPGLALTPAGQQGRVLSMDGLFLLGFGPRLGQAALALNEALYDIPSKTDSNDLNTRQYR